MAETNLIQSDFDFTSTGDLLNIDTNNALKDFYDPKPEDKEEDTTSKEKVKTKVKTKDKLTTSANLDDAEIEADKNIKPEIKEFFTSKNNTLEDDKEDTTNKDKTPTKDKVELESPFKVLAEDFVEKGILEFASIPEDYKGTEEEFRSLIAEDRRLAREADIQEFADSLQDEGKALIKHIQSGGKISDFVEVHATDISGLDPTNEDQQRQILNTFYKETLPYLKEDKRKAKIDKLIDSGLAESEATDAIEQWDTIKNNKIAALEAKTTAETEAKENNRLQTITDIKDFINKTDTIKGLIPLNTPKAKKQLEDFLFKPTVRLKSGQMVSANQAYDMTHSDNIENFMTNIFLKMNDYKLDFAKDLAKTEVTSKLTDKLRNYQPKLKNNGDEVDTKKINDTRKAWSFLD